MANSFLAQSYRHMHPAHQHQELERGRSRTPKFTPKSLAFGGNASDQHRRCHSTRLPSTATPHTRHTVYRPPRPPPPPPPKGKSPDRSEPGALEDAIHEAHARGDLRQCLQWVLELQGVYLDWDDPRLDTVTEDDLCFAESAGMGPDATPAERLRAERDWAMRKAEEEEERRVWELTATPEEKEVSRKLRAQLAAKERKRDARAQYFRVPRADKEPSAIARQRPPRPPHSVNSVVMSCSMDSTDTASTVIRRPRPRLREEFIFPVVDEAEMSAVRSMWLEQRRKGLAIVETLVQTPVKNPTQAPDTAKPVVKSPRLECPDTSNDNNALSSVSTSASSSCSAPSALFSSILTTTSVATSVSTVTQSSSPSCPSKVSSPRISRAASPAPAPAQSIRRFISVPSTESPLHRHAASVSIRETLEDDRDARSHGHRRTQSVPHNPARGIPRRTRSASPKGWLSKGSRAVEGLVDLASKLPSAYLPTSPLQDYPIGSMLYAPATRISLPNPSPPVIFLESLRRPVRVPIIPPIPALPRSPRRLLRQTSQQAMNPIRKVPNPHFLRLMALQNRVDWGLVPMSQAECEVLADIERIHQSECPDKDRCGHMFIAKEALCRVAADGLGKSALSAELAPAVDETSAMAALWSWWPLRL